MEREDILERVRNGKKNEEYEFRMIFRGLTWGIASIAFLYVLLMVVNIFVLNKQDVGDLTCLAAGFAGVTSICCYIYSKKKRFLVIGIGSLLLAICTFITFILFA